MTMSVFFIESKFDCALCTGVLFYNILCLRQQIRMYSILNGKLHFLSAAVNYQQRW
jgi:hypothetical protein